MHMQRCFLSVVLQKIFLVQDFIKIYRENLASEGVARLDLASMIKLNDILRPWFQILVLILKHKQCERICALNGGDTSGITKDLDKVDIVYARINIECNAMYIGRTGDFSNRCKAHFSATWRHNNECAEKCKGCREHVRYIKHRPYLPEKWIMIPISLCESKAEAIATESFLIKKWQPSINGADKERPYWMVRPTYSKVELVHVAKKIRTFKKPWTADTNRPKVVLESPWGKAMLTTYMVNGKSYYNFGNLLCY